MKRTYPAHEAKAKLGEILQRVQKGDRILITLRGKEVAEVRPVERSTDIASRLEQLERDGVLSRGTGGPVRPAALARRPGALARFLRSRD